MHWYCQKELSCLETNGPSKERPQPASDAFKKSMIDVSLNDVNIKHFSAYLRTRSTRAGLQNFVFVYLSCLAAFRSSVSLACYFTSASMHLTLGELFLYRLRSVCLFLTLILRGLCLLRCHFVKTLQSETAFAFLLDRREMKDVGQTSHL